MTANDAFPIIDPSAVSGSSDLFGGDLFGDELMDMYNSHADTTLDDTGGVGVGVAVSTADGMGTGNTNSVVASSHQGAQVAMTAAALGKHPILSTAANRLMIASMPRSERT